jgi:regulator of ribonuclease activity A
MPTQRRNEGQRDIEIQIQGMSIRSGEWLYADADGIVIAANALI